MSTDGHGKAYKRKRELKNFIMLSVFYLVVVLPKALLGRVAVLAPLTIPAPKLVHTRMFHVHLPKARDV